MKKYPPTTCSTWHAPPLRYLYREVRSYEEASKKKGFLGGKFYKKLVRPCEPAQRALKSSAIDGAGHGDELGKKSCQKNRSEREVRAILVLG